MNGHGYYYSRTALSGISEGLNKIFASLRRESGDVFVRAASSNVIIPVSSAKHLNELDAFIDELTLLNPARFFVLVLDNAADNLRADITARCHGLTSTQHVCCEVVRLTCKPDNMGAIAELLRANLLPGMSSKLFLYDAQIDLAVIDHLGGICDQIVFDSSELEKRFEAISRLLSVGSELIDMQWVALGLWRDQIKLTFDRSDMQESLKFLETISISADTAEEHFDSEARPGMRGRAACLMLMAGWFVNRLGLEIFACGQSGYDCYTPQGKIVKLVLESNRHNGASRLRQVELSFKAAGVENASLLLKRAEQLETTLQLKERIVSSCFFEDESRWGLIKRYFQIGEVFDSYNEALRSAVDLKTLRDDEG